MAEQEQCRNAIDQAKLNNSRLKDFWAQFGSNCPAPNPWCECCSGADYWPAMGQNGITICWNKVQGNEDALVSQLIHEATHYIQYQCRGGKPGRSCEDNLKLELEAFSCSKKCGDFGSCLYKALGSSCSGGYCTSDAAKDGYTNLKNWFGNTQSSFCKTGQLSP